MRNSISNCRSGLSAQWHSAREVDQGEAFGIGALRNRSLVLLTTACAISCPAFAEAHLAVPKFVKSIERVWADLHTRPSIKRFIVQLPNRPFAVALHERCQARPSLPRAIIGESADRLIRVVRMSSAHWPEPSAADPKTPSTHPQSCVSRIADHKNS